MADGRVDQIDPEIIPDTEQNDGIPPICKSRLLSWRLLGAVLALLVVLGWVFIIVMLILEEKWQLVLVAWLLLYSAAHFCYWYCKRHSIITFHRQQIRLRVLTRMRPGESSEKIEDTPPDYDEVMDAEAPPPAYISVVEETTKPIIESPPPYMREDMDTCVPTISGIVQQETSGADAKGYLQYKPYSSQENVETCVPTISGFMQQEISGADAKEYLQCPPAYQTPVRKISPRILPGVHQLRAPTDTAVTATAAATAIATAAAALTSMSPTLNRRESRQLEEDPIRGPIVRHLRSTTIATLDVSSTEDVTPSVSRCPSEQDEDEIDLQAPTTMIPGFP